MQGVNKKKYDMGDLLSLWRAFGLSFCRHIELSEKNHPVMKNKCWIWTGVRSSTGYGVAAFIKKRANAHKVAYILYKGFVPDGMHVLHRCDVRECVNPNHLFLGTHADNMRDATDKERTVTGSAHHYSKLTEDEVRQIRNLHYRGTNYGQLSKAFRISKKQAKRICRMESRKHDGLVEWKQHRSAADIVNKSGGHWRCAQSIGFRAAAKVDEKLPEVLGEPCAKCRRLYEEATKP